MKQFASFSCACPVIDHEFRHNIVKVAVDPRGDSVNLFYYDYKLPNCPLSLVDSSQKLEIHVCLFIDNEN